MLLTSDQAPVENLDPGCKWFTVNKYVVVNECVPVYGLKFATRATKSDGQRKFPCFVQFL